MVHHQVQKSFSDIHSALVSHWLELPREHHPIAPRKKDVSLPKLARIAPYLGMAEDGGPDALHVRLVGSEVDESVGKNLQHTNAYDDYDPDAKVWVHNMFRSIWDAPMGITHTLAFHFSKKPLYSLKILHLPLCDDDGICRFCISCFERGDTVIDLEEYQPSPIRLKDFSNLRAIDLGAGTHELAALPGENSALPPIVLSDHFS